MMATTTTSPACASGHAALHPLNKASQALRAALYWRCLVAAVLGTSAGVAFGWETGWLVALFAQAGLIAITLSATGSAGRRSTVPAGAFVFAWVVGLYSAGYAGFVAGAPDGLQAWALVVCALYVLAQALACAALVMLVMRLHKSNALRWFVLWPLAWMAYEWTMSLGPAALPWLRLGQLQAPGGPFAAMLPVGGSLLAGALMWIAAAAAAFAWRSDTAVHAPQASATVARRRIMRFTALFAVVAALCAINPLLPVWTQTADDVNVAVIQPGRASSQWAPPAASYPNARQAGMQALLDHYLTAADTASAGGARLIVTPQLALPKALSALPDVYLRTLEQTVARNDADVLLGLYTDTPNGPPYNSLLGLGTSGRQRYLKQQPFPFGETVPLPEPVRTWLDRLAGRSIQPAMRGPSSQPAFQAGGAMVAASICFEAAFPMLWRETAAAAGLIVNASSDSSIRSTQMRRQARQMLQARAIEFGKPIVRSSDIDGSFVIDARGRATDALPAFVQDVLQAKVQARQGLTPYARFGDAAAAAFSALLLGCGLFMVRLRRRLGGAGSGNPIAGRRRQSGQVMLPAIVLLLITGGLTYLMVNSSQAVNEKMRVTNAADAAAYSAGVVEARALNYDAYMNRAIIANQMAIAQAVSVASWLQYIANVADYGYAEAAENAAIMLAPPIAADDFAKVTQFSSRVAGLLALSYYTGTSITEYAELIINYGLMPAIYVSDIVSQALSLSQEAMHLSLTAGIRQGQIADDVVTAIDPQLEAEVVLVSHGFDAFTKSYTGDERGRLAEVAMRSRDLFTRERNWTAESIDVPVIRKDGALKKRAGTDLVGYDEWRGIDTLELHGRNWGCGSLGVKWCDDIEQPVGWGGMIASSNGDEGPGYHGNAYGENETTAERAEDDPYTVDYTGLPATRDLDDLEEDAELDTGITIMVEKAHADTRTSGNGALARPSGRLDVFGERPAGQKLIALSRASVYFDRIAARADGKTEIASAYNPYWRVRLVAPTAGDKAYAATQQNGLFLP
jgi:apolipoprotein N-acyltransferase